MGAVNVLCADPPWRAADKLPGPGRGASRHYATMSVSDIQRCPLPPLAPDAILFMWRVAWMAEEALQVVRAWGFVPKSEIVWVKTAKTGKVRMGMGRTVRVSHETAIIATRGRGHRLVTDHSVPSVFFAERHAHSEKPAEFYRIVERLVPDANRVELFARSTRPGWRSYGLECPSGEVHP